jgi:spermidine/putrescine transport system ATP-binding protein
MTEAVVSFRGVTKRFKELVAIDGVSLDVRPGEFLTLLGPSGCGKTTILRLIAGLEAPDAGEIHLDGRRVDSMPPNRRDVNTVFQSYALFPHMTVFQNVAFGLKMKRVPAAELDRRVRATLQMVQLEGLADRRMHQLSGGQQQRVAVARAIVNRPRVLLLDEPFSALDARLRKQMQLEMKRLHRRLGITFIFVTHDQNEAISMSDRIVVMDHGRIEQVGTPQEIYEEPENLFVARFVGEINVFDAQVLQAAGGVMQGRVEGVEVPLTNRRGFRAGDRVKVLLRPEDLVVTKQSEGCEGPHLAGRVEELIYKGTTVDLIIRLPGGQAVFATEFFNEDAESISYQPQEPVCLSWIHGWEVVLPDEG